ncbi:MAG: helix-turn-helix domain-containing protein [Bacteriovoracaceae bacterium]|nr:helix-turn-helix domain-containing protein [Bacteriovoracaceae bacterium]
MEKEENKILIKDILQKKMIERRLSLRLLSRETNIPYSTLFSWREGRPPKDMVKAKRLADYLEISLDELMFGLPKNKNNSFKYTLSHELKKCVDDFVEKLNI